MRTCRHEWLFANLWFDKHAEASPPSVVLSSPRVTCSDERLVPTVPSEVTRGTGNTVTQRSEHSTPTGRHHVASRPGPLPPATAAGHNGRGALTCEDVKQVWRSDQVRTLSTAKRLRPWQLPNSPTLWQLGSCLFASEARRSSVALAVFIE